MVMILLFVVVGSSWFVGCFVGQLGSLSMHQEELVSKYSLYGKLFPHY